MDWKKFDRYDDSTHPSEYKPLLVSDGDRFDVAWFDIYWTDRYNRLIRFEVKYYAAFEAPKEGEHERQETSSD